MIQVGDMFLYIDDEDEAAFDVGWVVHTEKHSQDEGLANLIYIKWLFQPANTDSGVDHVWQHHLEAYNEFTLVKGGQHG